MGRPAVTVTDGFATVEFLAAKLIPSASASGMDTVWIRADLLDHLRGRGERRGVGDTLALRAARPDEADVDRERCEQEQRRHRKRCNHHYRAAFTPLIPRSLVPHVLLLLRPVCVDMDHDGGSGASISGTSRLIMRPRSSIWEVVRASHSLGGTGKSVVSIPSTDPGSPSPTCNSARQDAMGSTDCRCCDHRQSCAYSYRLNSGSLGGITRRGRSCRPPRVWPRSRRRHQRQLRDLG